MEERNKQKSISMRTVIVAIVVLVLVVAGASAVYFVMNKDEGAENNTVSNSAVNNTASANTTNNTTQTREVPSGMKLYDNTEYGFTALYPATWPIVSSVKNQTIGSTEVTRLSFNLYRPDIKSNEESLFVLLMRKDSIDQKPTNYLDDHFNPPTGTSWQEGDSDFAGGSKVFRLTGFDSIGEIGDLPYTGPYAESSDKKYVFFLAYPQDKDQYLSEIFGGTSYTMADFLKSWRWK